jgi:hypothetical protein
MEITEQLIVDRVLVIRGVKIMLDKDLAEIYGVEVKRLNEQVKRNHTRFPADFMFQLSSEEWLHLMSQNATSSWGGNRKLPNAFTEQGVAMLSSVLNSETAIQVNIQIIRVFTKMKQLLLENKELFLKIEKVEKQLTDHDKDLQNIFTILKKLIPLSETVKRNPIGFPYPKKK